MSTNDLRDPAADLERYGDLLPQLARRLGLAKLSDQNDPDMAARRLEQWLTTPAPDTDGRKPGATDVIVRGRQRGKSTALVAWLLEGHTITYGGWSRRLITADAQRASLLRDEVARQYADHLGRLATSLDADQRARVDTLRACVIHADQASRTLLGAQVEELAVDDAEAVLARALRVTQPLAVVAINGQEWRP